MPDDATVNHVQQGPTPKTGEIIAGYEILGVIGAGGMGRVYKVRHTLSNRIEAMKVVLPDLEGNPDLVNRFHREIQVLAGLNHPNIVALHTAMQVDHRLVMILEMVEGTSLKGVAKDGRLAVDDVIRYGCQVLGALGYAHEHGVVHRDVKPENILLTADGNIKLVDFGIARQELAPRLTSTGAAVGSLYYISPEQVQNHALDARSDIYSLGVTLYELLTGERPIKGETAFTLMNGHLNVIPEPPHTVIADVPMDLSNAIMKALAKDPADRFQTATEFHEALAGQCSTPVRPSVRGATVQAAVRGATVQAPIVVPTPPRRKLWPLVAAIAGVVVLGTVGAAFYLNRPAAAAKEPAVVTPAASTPTSTATSAPTPVPVAPAPAPEAKEPLKETPKEPLKDTATVKPAPTTAAPPKVPEKTSADRGMEAWPPGIWEREDDWFVHRGGDFVLFPVMPLNGTLSFSATMHAGGALGSIVKGGGLPGMKRGRKLQWVVDYRDKNNYLLFQIDDKSFVRKIVRGGKVVSETNVPHEPTSNLYTLQIAISPHNLTHSLTIGSEQKVLDKWDDDQQDLSSGSFGVYLPGHDEVGLANFKYSPRK
ncbi:MAG TPA: serine/threonine-protein kinase [Bryobacteraceae bacterium]|nr:serine/threonine-protein kinase [Bryobacteraceae bacterium]